MYFNHFPLLEIRNIIQYLTFLLAINTSYTHFKCFLDSDKCSKMAP